MKEKNYTQTMKTSASSISLGALAAVCLYAVIFMHRPDHLLTTAVYAAMIWMVNRKEK